MADVISLDLMVRHLTPALLGISGVCGGLLTLRKFNKEVIRPRWKASKICRVLDQAPEAIDLITKYAPLIEKTYNETQANGQSTMRDAISRIEGAQNAFIGVSNTPILQFDGNGLCVKANRQWCNLTGQLPSDSDGSGWLNAVCSCDRDKVRLQWAAAINEKRDFTQMFKVVHRATKHEFLVAAHAEWVRDALQRPIYVIGSFGQQNLETV